MRLWVLLCLSSVLAVAEPYRFRLDREAEAVATLSLSGQEATYATLVLDGKPQQQIPLIQAAAYEQRVFLGRLPAGEHRIEMQQAELRQASVQADASPAVQHAPILFARKDTVGRFSDVPLLAYVEKLTEQGQPLLQYTVIFSNEDGGTSTRALMARWGRATDIEYVYKVFLDAHGNKQRATVQGRNHIEAEYSGPYEGQHPLLQPVTLNNMVSAGEPNELRHQLAPLLVDLTSASREQVMDTHPWTYSAMGRELVRENKLRAFGTVQGELISDPRNYLFIEMKLELQNSAVGVRVRRKGERRWYASDLGRLDYAISRPDWVRTTIELPPGTQPEQIEEIGLHCLAVPTDRSGSMPATARCRVLQVSQAFFLDSEYQPRPSVWSLSAVQDLAMGELRGFVAARK